jgi:sucrose phosphorylase
VNTRRNNDGKDVPYELNITYLDSLMSTREGMDEYQADRFLCSQTIMCSLKGIPAVYINSILGGKNYTEGVKQTGMNRTINRQKWDSVILQEDLLTDALRSKIIKAYRHMLQVRKITPEFHPNTDQEIQFLRKTLFIIKRAKNALISVSNISKTDQVIQISAILKDNKHLIDILSGERVEDEIRLKPYQTVWLKEISPAATQEKTLL